ncbi:MAG: DUF2341 domain-containing protein [Candidatus Hodarchaeales archaeon]|jgi:hypothetical protein
MRIRQLISLSLILVNLLTLSSILVNCQTSIIIENNQLKKKVKLNPEEKNSYPVFLKEISENTGNERSEQINDNNSKNIAGQQVSNNNPVSSYTNRLNLNDQQSRIHEPRYKPQSDFWTPNWTDTRWHCRKNLTIDHTKVDANLTDFPVYVELLDSDLQDEAQTDAADIFFTDVSGERIAHEVELYNSTYNSSHARLVTWVKANLSNSQDTIISMYYGNATAANQENVTAVWDDNYVAVWHMNDDPTDTVHDSTNTSNGTSSGSMTPDDLVPSKLGGGIDFDGSNDVIICPDPLNGSFLTVSAWVKLVADATFYHSIVSRGNDDFRLTAREVTGNPFIVVTSGGFGLGPSVAGDWYHLTGTYDGSTLKGYRDGAFFLSNSQNAFNDTYPDIWIGGRPTTSWYLKGIIDELRISNVSRSAEWISAEFHNQNDTNSFYSIGNEEYSPDNTPPIASNMQITPSNPMSNETLTATYDYHDLDNDPENGSEIRWYRDGVLVTELNDLVTVNKSYTTRDEDWYYVVRPYDGTWFGNPKQSSNVTVQNTPPVVTNVWITPDNPGEDEDIQSHYDWYDEDGQNVTTWGIFWYKDGVSQIDLVGNPNLPAAKTHNGEEWYVRIWVIETTPPLANSESNQSAIFIIGNVAPTVSNLQISPVSPVTGDDLVANYNYTDPGNDPENGSQVSWYRDGVVVPALENLSIVPANYTSKGEQWHFKVRPSDGIDFGNLTSCLVNTTIINTAPIASDARMCGYNQSTMINSSTDLVVTYVYSDVDGDPEVIGQKMIFWYKGGVLQGNLNGSITVGSGNSTIGDIWYVNVSVNDGTNYSSFTISLSMSIGVAPNNTPEVSYLNFTVVNPTTTDYLYINYIYSDLDNDTESGTMFYWYRDGVHVSQYDGWRNLSSSFTSKGEEWHVKVHPRDGYDFGTLVGSPNVTIGNTAPDVTSLEITPNDPKTVNNITAVYTFTDIDGDPENGTEIIWYLNGILQGSFNNSFTVLANFTEKGQEWHFKIRPKDNETFGDWYGCPVNITVLNSIPIASNLQIIPSDPKTTDGLITKYSYFDEDGDFENDSLIQWYRNGVEQPAYENQTTIPATVTNKGEYWYFTVLAKDGKDYSSPYVSPNVQILNSQIQITSVEINGNDSTARVADGLIVVIYFNDPDGDLLPTDQIIYWYINGVIDDELVNMTTVPAYKLVKSDFWYCVYRVSDDAGEWSGNKTSQLMTIVNSAPSVINVLMTFEHGKDVVTSTKHHLFLHRY